MLTDGRLNLDEAEWTPTSAHAERISWAHGPGPGHPAPGALEPRPRRSPAPRTGPAPRHPPPACGDPCPPAWTPRWRDHLRRPDERQRRGRLHPPRDRLDRRAACRRQAVPRHLPRRADAGPPPRPSRRAASRRARRGRLLPDPRHREGRQVWPVFPAKVYQWHREGFDLPTGATLLAEGDDFEAQAFRYGHAIPTGCSSTPRSPTT